MPAKQSNRTTAAVPVSRRSPSATAPATTSFARGARSAMNAKNKLAADKQANNRNPHAQ